MATWNGIEVGVRLNLGWPWQAQYPLFIFPIENITVNVKKEIPIIFIYKGEEREREKNIITWYTNRYSFLFSFSFFRIYKSKLLTSHIFSFYKGDSANMLNQLSKRGNLLLQEKKGTTYTIEKLFVNNLNHKIFLPYIL